MKIYNTSILMVIIILLAISCATANEPNILAQFDTLNQNVVFLPVTIAGTEHLFFLDTGANYTVFDLSLKKYLGKERGSELAVTHGKLLPVKRYDAPESFIGQIKLGCEEVYCADMTLLSMIYGKKISGVVGMDFLKRYIVQLDFDNGKIFFFKSETNKKSEWGEYLNLKFFEGLPSIDIKFQDIPITFFIDTGRNASVDLNVNNFKRLISKGEMNTTSGFMGTISGKVDFHSVRYKNFTIEPFGNHNIIINSNPYKHLIGTGYLSRFIVTFDFPHSKVYLKESKNFNRVDEVDMSGLHILLISNDVVVHSVDANSPSSEAGIQANDIILKVNNKDANTYSMFELRELLMSCDKQKITMTIKRDDEIKEVSFLLKRKI